MNKRLLTAAIAAVAAVMPLSARLWINELMQSNIDGVYVDGDFPDSWVEIYNDGETSVRMNGYRFGESDNFDEAFELKASVGVGPGNYNLFYFDKVAKGYHTDFRLDSGKGKLYLFSPDGDIVDCVSYPKMAAPGVAYGRVEDGGDEWGFELTPTPRAKNSGGVTSRVLPDPVFSVSGTAHLGVRRLQEVTVSMPEGVDLPADTRLYVTTDGSEPTVDSPSYDSIFVKRSQASMVIRAKLISAQAVSPRAVTHSYIYHQRDAGLPVISLNTDRDFLFDDATGIWNNFNEDWRRPVNVEYFTSSGGGSELNQLGEFRIHGGWSRNQAQKSFAVYSNKRFGTKKYSYPFFPDKPEIKKSKSFVLRNGGNAFTEARINDSFVQVLFGRNCPNLDWQAYQPVICYINGEYRGIYALRQRSNEDYVEDCYDGLEDIDMMENWDELKAGTTDSFEAFRQLYESNPTYRQMEQAMDVEEFANLYIADAWAANTDFPGNNIVMWRPTAADGKWRWIMKDVDFFASNPAGFNYFDFILHTGDYDNKNIGEGNAAHAVKLFKVMTALPEFREKFIDRFLVYLGDFLRADVTSALIDEQREQLSAEYASHLACYGWPNSFDGWNRRVDDLKRWSAQRTALMPGIICSYFGLDEPVDVTVDGGDSGLSINGIELTGSSFAGKWPTGREIEVESRNHSLGWEVALFYNNGRRRSYQVNEPRCNITMAPTVKSMSIKAVQFSGVGNAVADDEAGIGVAVSGDIVTLTSGAIMTAVSVCDMSGRYILSLSPMSATAQFRLDSGAYIVEAVNENGYRHVCKLIVR